MNYSGLIPIDITWCWDSKGSSKIIIFMINPKLDNWMK